jgi:hypothetical protein
LLKKKIFNNVDFLDIANEVVLMRRMYLLLLIVILFAGCTNNCAKPNLVIGNECCIDANNNGICDKNEPAKEPPQVEEQNTQELPPVVVQEEQAVKEMNSSTKELLSKSKTKVKNFAYYYFGPPDPAHGISFTYKGDILKVMYTTKRYDANKNPYDTVYLNITSKTATAYCESISSCDNRDLGIEVGYADNYRIMPTEIIDSIKFAEQTGVEQIDNKNAIKLSFDDSKGNKGNIYLWEFNGMPLIVEYTEPKASKLEYRDMTVNSVEDTDITHTKKKG